jgi:hypothetical protein
MPFDMERIMIIRGGCLCGAVAYEARLPIAKCDFVLQQVRIAGAASYAERPRGRSPGWLAQ